MEREDNKRLQNREHKKSVIANTRPHLQRLEPHHRVVIGEMYHPTLLDHVGSCTARAPDRLHHPHQWNITVLRQTASSQTYIDSSSVK